MQSFNRVNPSILGMRKSVRTKLNTPSANSSKACFIVLALVLNNIGKKSSAKRAEDFQELQRLGVVGTQSQIREIDRLISEGLGGTRAAEIDELGIPTSGSFA